MIIILIWDFFVPMPVPLPGIFMHRGAKVGKVTVFVPAMARSAPPPCALLALTNTLTLLSLSNRSLDTGIEIPPPIQYSLTTSILTQAEYTMLTPETLRQLENDNLECLEHRGDAIQLVDMRRIELALSKTTKLEVLNLPSSYIGDIVVANLATRLKNNTSVKAINLSGNFITNEGAKVLLGLLEKNKTITHIDLHDNPIADELLLKAIRDRLAQNVPRGMPRRSSSRKRISHGNSSVTKPAVVYSSLAPALPESDPGYAPAPALLSTVAASEYIPVPAARVDEPPTSTRSRPKGRSTMSFSSTTVSVSTMTHATLHAPSSASTLPRPTGRRSTVAPLSMSGRK